MVREVVNAVPNHPVPYQLKGDDILNLVRERENGTGKSGSRTTPVPTESLDFTGFFKQMVRGTAYFFTLYIESKIY